MAKRKDAKSKSLQEHGSLNPKPRNVSDAIFQDSEFFDPRDLVQVKYEMLRSVQIEQRAVTDAAAAFGFSRPAFYLARAAFQRGGLPGLIPRRRGPRHAHKLSESVLTFIEQQKLKDKRLRAPALVKMVQQQFGLKVHPRSIERALLRKQKKGR